MTLTPLPPAPSRTSPSTFSALADAFVAALPTLVNEINSLTFGEASARNNIDVIHHTTGYDILTIGSDVTFGTTGVDGCLIYGTSVAQLNIAFSSGAPSGRKFTLYLYNSLGILNCTGEVINIGLLGVYEPLTTIEFTYISDLNSWYITSARSPYTSAVHQISLSNLTTAIMTGTSVGYFRTVKAGKIWGLSTSLLTASTSGVVQVGININGTSALLTPVTIDANQKTSLTSATPYVASNITVAADDEITFNILSAGTGAKGLIISLTLLELL